MQLDAMVDALGTLVSVESPSNDVPSLNACATVVADLGSSLLGEAPEVLDGGGRPFLRWSFGGGPPRVVLVGHLDTVWPLGTLARWPFSVDSSTGVATGPGSFDMKSGLVQGFYALSTLDSLDGVAVVVNADEEIGSPGSRGLIEESVRDAEAALVLEPAAGGSLKTARKGVSMYSVLVDGRAAHAGLEPEKGANATVGLAHAVLGLSGLGSEAEQTTVTPTVASSGTTMNTVPAAASVHVDVRAFTVAEQERVDREIKALAGPVPTVPGAVVRVEGGINRPPFPPSASASLYEMAGRIAESLELPALSSIAVGGGSDGNFTAGLGVPTLDGLGAVGDHAHAEGEYVVVGAMVDRARLVAGLVRELLVVRSA